MSFIDLPLIIAVCILGLVLWGAYKVPFSITSHFHIILVIEEWNAFKSFRSPQSVAKQYGLDQVELTKLLGEMTKAGWFECKDKKIPSLGSVTFYRYRKV